MTDTGLLRRAGYVPGPAPVFYEELGASGTGHPTIVLVHGGGFSGSCYLTTPDGRPGWAFDFARHGYRVIVPDWPGVGRSASVPPDAVDGETVARALCALLDHLGRRTVLLVHSMAGPYGFKVLETHGHLVRALVAVAPGPPGNIQPVSEPLHETAAEVTIATPSVTLTVPRTGVWRPTTEFVERKLMGAGTRLAPRDVPALLAQTAPVPVRLLMGRTNLHGAQLTVERRDHFAGKPVLVLTGSDDSDHPGATDRATTEWLRETGADADHHLLGDQGVHGNGHMLMSEDNSSGIADAIAAWLARH
ncbi:alpha/beta fold hydrolase [Streptomyces sp. NPDC048639]|uniref:alpha/beta fold hydrolase n=1 Tax=Streptomyces sp. NPDC048639 TaxID=3365581 RepID=UPI00371DCE01